MGTNKHKVEQHQMIMLLFTCLTNTPKGKATCRTKNLYYCWVFERDLVCFLSLTWKIWGNYWFNMLCFKIYYCLNVVKILGGIFELHFIRLTERKDKHEKCIMVHHLSCSFQLLWMFWITLYCLVVLNSLYLEMSITWSCLIPVRDHTLFMSA